MLTILTDIISDNPAAHTEIFGSVAQVYWVHREEEDNCILNLITLACK